VIEHLRAPVGGREKAFIILIFSLQLVWDIDREDLATVSF